MSDLNIVSASKQDIYNKFLGLAEHYFGENTDFLKSGMMSYITECMASVMRDSAIHKTMLYNESFLNTAIIEKSVYNWAKMFNIEIPKAQPAFADILLTISVDDLSIMLAKKTRNQTSLQKFGSDVYDANNSGNIFIIDRANPLIIGSYYFALERSVIIEKREGSFVVRYCNTELPATTTFGDMDETYLKTTITASAGNQYLSFIVRAWQYKVTSIEKQLTSNSFSDIKIHTFDFTDQLAGIRLQYKKNNITKSIPLIFSDSVDNKEELYAYYALTDSNKVQIKFLNDIFLPSVGGTLLVDLYTTFGASGNNSFTSDLVFTLEDEDYRSLAITASFVDYQSYGGKDVPSLQTIKSNIISEISTKNVIVTESDLNNYFFKLQSLLESINDGKVKFVKKRDDLIKRTFNAYLLLRSGLNIDNNTANGAGYRSSCIPTNTVDITFPVSANISKKFGSTIREVVTDNTKNIVEYRYSPDLSVSDDCYIIPFYMRIMVSPIKKVKYIYNIADDSTSLKYTDIKSYGSISTSGKDSDVITPLTVSVKRELNGNNVSNYYTISFNFASNFQLTEENINDLKLTLTSTDGLQNPFSLFDNNITMGENSFTYEIESLQSDDDGSLYNTSIKINLYVADEEFDFTSLNDFGSKLKFKFNGISVTENIGVKLDLNLIHDNSKFEFAIASDRNLGVFRSLDSILNSDIVINTETQTEGETTKEYIKSIILKEVPVVHSSFFNNEVNKTKFIKQLFTYIDLLNENMEKLETNTFFNLKFMNTYGYSQQYNSLTTNLDLKMTIYLKQGVDRSNTSIQNQIRDYIRVVVDKFNNEECLSVSTIITLVSAAYANYVDHIVFEGLNGTFTQYINKLDSNQEVPEYFNLDPSKLKTSIQFK